MSIARFLMPKFGRVCPQSCLEVDKDIVARKEGVVTRGGCEGGRRWSCGGRMQPDVVHWKTRVCVHACGVCVCV